MPHRSGYSCKRYLRNITTRLSPQGTRRGSKSFPSHQHQQACSLAWLQCLEQLQTQKLFLFGFEILFADDAAIPQVGKPLQFIQV